MKENEKGIFSSPKVVPNGQFCVFSPNITESGQLNQSIKSGGGFFRWEDSNAKFQGTQKKTRKYDTKK